MFRSGLKISAHVREQGVPRIENGVRHTFWRMSISIRGKTQLSDIRWGFETISTSVCQTLNRSRYQASASDE
jgi:hypothetical protein